MPVAVFVRLKHPLKFIFSQIMAARSMVSSCDGVNKNAPFARKFPESESSESVSSWCLSFHKFLCGILGDSSGFCIKLLELRWRLKSDTALLSCSASEPMYDMMGAKIVEHNFSIHFSPSEKNFRLKDYLMRIDTFIVTQTWTVTKQGKFDRQSRRHERRCNRKSGLINFFRTIWARDFVACFAVHLICEFTFVSWSNFKQ